MLTVVLAAVLMAAPAARGIEGAGEYELKAAFLYNFAKYVEWPADAAASRTNAVCIGIVGADPFGATIDRLLADKRVQSKPIEIRRFPSFATVHDCDVVFVSAATEAVPVEGSYVRTGMLTVGETPAFLGRGGVVAFSMEGGKLRFAVNAVAAERAGLKLSSQLMKLAVHVVNEGE